MTQVLTVAVIIDTAGLLLLFVLCLGAYHAIGRLQLSGIAMKPTPSRLLKGEVVDTVDLGPLPLRTMLLFVSYGCSGCADISRQLSAIDLANWSLVTVIRGLPAPAPTADIADRLERAGMTSAGEFELPTASDRIVRDPSGAISRLFGVTNYPTVLALINGRLVDHGVAPSPDWIADMTRRRREKAFEKLGGGNERSVELV